MRSARVLADRDEVETGPIKLRRTRREARILAIAGRRIVLHVDRNDGSPRQQVSEVLGHAIAYDLESKIEVDLLSGRNHGSSEFVGRRASNFSAIDPNHRSGVRVFDGMEKTLHVVQE
jgi:hypothetical protein